MAPVEPMAPTCSSNPSLPPRQITSGVPPTDTCGSRLAGTHYAWLARPASAGTERGPRLRIALVVVPLLAGFACLGARMVQIQVLEREKWSRAAQRQRLSIERQAAPRGMITAGRETVVQSVPRATLLADLKVLQDREAAAAALAPLLGCPAAGLVARMEQENRRIVYLARDLEPELAQQVRELKIKGLGFEESYLRTYPQGRLACHVIGWSGLDGGKEGLEFNLDGLLRGIPGYWVYERDAARRPLSRGHENTATPRASAPQPGLSVALTLHPGIQFVAEEELARVMRDFQPLAATATVMDVRTGAILALACQPSYDPGFPTQASAYARRIRTVADGYEPGSTFKAFIAAWALERGLCSRTDLIHCENGAWNLGYRTLHDTHAYGVLTFDEFLIHSSNIAAAKTGLRLGLDGTYAAVVAFGFGARTGIDLPGEFQGLLRPRKVWTKDSLLSVPMGHELTVTPVQLLSAYAAMVNGGVLLRPQVIAGISNARGETLYAMRPQPVRRVLSAQTSKSMREILRRAVEEGTGRKAWCREYAIGGKTGTAQKEAHGRYDHEKFVGSFCGFAPADRPRLVCLVTVDEPKKSLGYYGGTVAAPAVREILRRGLHALNVPPRSSIGQPQAVRQFEARTAGAGY